jgi:GDP-L-fucose synthase
VGGIVANDRWPAQFLYDNLAIATNVIHAADAVDVEKLLSHHQPCDPSTHTKSARNQDHRGDGLAGMGIWHAEA